MQRKCVGCGTFHSRENMVRVTKTASGTVVVNGNSKTFGRSAYLCYNKSCIENALKKSRLQKVLKTALNDDIIEEIRGLVNV